MKKPLFEKVTIVGPGLIGGSLGLALRREHLAGRIVGVGRRPESLKAAEDLGAVDTGTTDLLGAVADADLVVLATRVGQIMEQARELLPRMKQGALLTDVGSVKAAICNAVQPHLTPGVRFVGGHPMAGSEKQGVSAARADLFAHAVCILTPVRECDADGSGLAQARALWESVGCRVREMDPVTHDLLVAQCSHLPHVAAVALMNCISDEALALAAGGLRDASRIASSDPLMWLDICLANREAISRALRGYSNELREFAQALEAQDADSLRRQLTQAQARRDARWK